MSRGVMGALAGLSVVLVLLLGTSAAADSAGPRPRLAETAAQRLSGESPGPEHTRLRGSSHLQKEYEDFDAEERHGTRFNESLFRHEAHLETVARMESHHGKGKPSSQAGPVVGSEQQPSQEEDSDEILRLIDSDSNEYVMVRPHEGLEQMELQEDKELISDIVKVIVAAVIGGLFAGLLGQPVISGYLVAGSIIGPGGLGVIQELVQVETLAQFGAVFLIFVLGVEFSTDQVAPVRTAALVGGVGITVCLGLSGIGIASIFGVHWKQGLLIGMFVSMSSTAIVLKCLMESKEVHTRHGRVMLGILLLQDCMVGLFLALLPALAAVDDAGGRGAVLLAIGAELLKLGAFLLVALLFSRLMMPSVLVMLGRLSSRSAELYQLAIIAECLSLAVISEHLGLSIEVGAFVGGLMLSSSRDSKRILENIEPVRNLFASLFISCIGLVMQPHFLWAHMELLLTSFAVVLIGKCTITACLVRLLGDSCHTAVMVGIGLGQIGEFAFLLLSHARRLKLIPKRMYLLTLGTSALSLLLTPLQWKIATFLSSRWKQPSREDTEEGPCQVEADMPLSREQAKDM